MKLFYILLLSCASTSFAQASFNLSDKLKLTASCQLAYGGRAYYLNLCPAGMVMVGANALPGESTTIQVLCARLEIRCE